MERQDREGKKIMVGIDIATENRRHPNGRKKKRDLLHSLSGQRTVIVYDGGSYAGVINVGKDNSVFVDGTPLSIADVKRVYPYIPQVDLYAGRVR